MNPDWQDSLTDPITLAGEFSCRLTTAERNEWFRFARGNPVFIELQQLSAELERRKYGGEDCEDAVRECFEAVARMHEVAAEWFEGVKARRAAAAKRDQWLAVARECQAAHEAEGGAA